MKSVENIYDALVKYLGLDDQKTDYNVSLDVDVKTHVGAVIGKMGLYATTILGLGTLSGFFPPLFVITIPVSFIVGYFLGGNIVESIKKVFSKRERLIGALNDINQSQIDEFKLMKERFIRDLEEKKEILENNMMSLINIKTLELSSKSKETKEFYTQLKEDYERLLDNIKSQFNI